MRSAVIVAVFVPLGLVSVRQQPQFRATTSLVRLTVSVTDEHGAIRGLAPDAFVVEDRGARQRVRVEESVDVPLDLVLVAPPLASVDYIAAGQAERVAAGVSAFLAQVEGRDRLAAIVAGTPPTRLRSLAFGRPAFDAAAFEGAAYAAPFDAIAAALGEFDASDRRRALVAFTNAADFRSTVSFDALTDLAGRLGPAFVLFGTPVKIREEVNVHAELGGGGPIGDRATAVTSGYVFPARLQRLAHRTGGIAINLASDAPARVMADFFAWLRTQYVISYEPPPGTGWHPVTVRVNRGGARVTAREGYFVD